MSDPATLRMVEVAELKAECDRLRADREYLWKLLEEAIPRILPQWQKMYREALKSKKP